MRERAVKPFSVGIHGGGKVDPARVGHAVHENVGICEAVALLGEAVDPEEGIERGLHVHGPGREARQEGLEDGREDEDDARVRKETAISLDVLRDVLGTSVAPAVDHDGRGVQRFTFAIALGLVEDVDLLAETGEPSEGVLGDIEELFLLLLGHDRSRRWRAGGGDEQDRVEAIPSKDRSTTFVWCPQR